MEDRNQYIDQYFRQQLGSYTEQPAPDVWAALEQRLDEKPRKKRVLWVWFTLLFMAAIGGTTYFTHSATGENPAPETKKATATSVNIPAIEKPAANVVSRTDKSSLSTNHLAKKNTPQQRKYTSSKISEGSIPAKPVPIASQSMSERTINQPGQTSIANETPAMVTAPLKPIDPLTSELEKPETERDILQLLPTAGITVPVEKMNEEEYLALAPMSGNKSADKLATQVSAASATEPASTTDSIETASKTEPTKATENQQASLINPIVDTLKAKKEHPRRFTAGLKTGYEFGTKPYHANSFVLSPYLQYNFTKRLGLLLQPAFKYSHSSAAVLSHGSYAQTTDSLKEMLPPIIPNAGSGFPTGNDEYMAYQKTYDSIFIRSELRDVRYWNLDLPLMLSYKVHKNFSVYAGPAFHFTKVPKVITTKQTYSGLVLNDTLRMERKPMSVEFDTLDINEVFPQKGFDISQYNGSAFDNPTINPFKMGVTFGLSYTFRQRFHFDILYRQTLSKMDYIANDKVREILKQPYIRVTLGFDLLK